MTKRLVRVSFAGVVLFLAVQLLFRFFPMDYEEEIRRFAAQNGLDPALVAAQIKVESNFQTDAVSHKGAVGLMQILPATGAWCAEKMHLLDYENLVDTEINIQIGTWYDRYLLEKTGSDVWMLAAYNGGIANVESWRATGAEKIEDIPFPETQKYVQKVLSFQKVYAILYKFHFKH